MTDKQQFIVRVGKMDSKEEIDKFVADLKAKMRGRKFTKNPLSPEDDVFTETKEPK